LRGGKRIARTIVMKSALKKHKGETEGKGGGSVFCALRGGHHGGGREWRKGGKGGREGKGDHSLSTKTE